MNGYHKKYTLHCEALSPIHIGSGEALSRCEYRDWETLRLS